MRLYGPAIYNLSLRFARDEAEAEDLTQEIFLKLYRRLDRYRGEVPLVAWALRLSRNLCIEHYRRSRRERLVAHVSPQVLTRVPGGGDPQAEALRRQRLALVYRALGEMGEEQALAVLLRDLQGLSYDEVAAFLEIPLGTLKSRLARGRRDLAERIARRLAAEDAQGAAKVGDPVGPAAAGAEVEPC